MSMKVFTSIDFPGFWPVGSAAVVVAGSEEEARMLLLAQLDKRKMGSSPSLGDEARKDGFTLQELDLSDPYAVVLLDGNY